MKIEVKHFCKLTVEDMQIIMMQPGELKNTQIVVVSKTKNKICCMSQLNQLIQLDFLQLKSTKIKDAYDLDENYDFWCWADPHTVTQVLSAGLK